MTLRLACRVVVGECEGACKDGGVNVVRLVGVYNADGTVFGELSYFVGKRLGRAHCALCDITHGLVRERPAWQECVAALPVPFEMFHRNTGCPSCRRRFERIAFSRDFVGAERAANP